MLAARPSEADEQRTAAVHQSQAVAEKAAVRATRVRQRSLVVVAVGLVVGFVFIAVTVASPD